MADVLRDACVLHERRDVIKLLRQGLGDVEQAFERLLLRVAQFGVDLLQLLLALLHLLKGLLDLLQFLADLLFLALLDAVAYLLEFGGRGLLLDLLGVVLVGFALRLVFLFLLQRLLQRIAAVAYEVELPGGDERGKVAEERESPDNGGRAAGLHVAFAVHVNASLNPMCRGCRTGIRGSRACGRRLCSDD